MDGFGGFVFKAEAAAATPARAAKKGVSSGDATTQILGDRSSRENVKPANNSNSSGGNGNAPSTPMAAGPLRCGAARARTGRATCPSSQKAYIQAANCKTTGLGLYPATPIAGPPPHSRGGVGQAAAASQLIFRNRELQNTNEELEGILRTSEKEKTQLKQRLRDVEAQVAAQSETANALRAAAASAAALATAETDKVKRALEAQITELRERHETDLAAAKVRVEAAEAATSRASSEAHAARLAAASAQETAEAAAAALKIGEATAKKAEAIAKSREAEIKNAADAAVETATASATSASVELSNAKAALVKAQTAEARAKTSTAKSQERNVAIRNRLATIVERVRGATAPGQGVSSISGRKRGRGASRGIVMGKQVGGQGAESDGANRSMFLEELCDLISFGTGRELPVDVLERFLSKAPSACPALPAEEEKCAPSDDAEAEVGPAMVAGGSNMMVTPEPAALAPSVNVSSRSKSRRKRTGVTVLAAGADGEAHDAEAERETKRLQRGLDAFPDAQSQAVSACQEAQVSAQPEGGKPQEVATPAPQQQQRSEGRKKVVKKQQASCRPCTTSDEGHDKPPPMQQRRRQQQLQQHVPGAASSPKKSTDTTLPALSLVDEACNSYDDGRNDRGDAVSEPLAAAAGAADTSSSATRSHPTAPEAPSASGEHEDEVGIEEVPMPVGGGDSDFDLFGGGAVATPVKEGAGTWAKGVCGGSPRVFAEAAAVTAEAVEAEVHACAPEIAEFTDTAEAAFEPLVSFVVGEQELGNASTAPESEGEVTAASKRARREKKKKDTAKSTRRRSLRQMERSAILFRERQQREEQEQENAAGGAAALLNSGAEAAIENSTNDTTTTTTTTNDTSDDLLIPDRTTFGANHSVVAAANKGTAAFVDTAMISPDTSISTAKKKDSGPARAFASPSRRSPRRHGSCGGSAADPAAISAIPFRTLGEKGHNGVLEDDVAGVRSKEEGPSRTGVAAARESEGGVLGNDGRGCGGGQTAAAEAEEAVVLPFGREEIAGVTMTPADIERVAKELFEDVYTPGGALAGVLAMAWILAEKFGTCGTVPATEAAITGESGNATRRLRSLLSAFVRAESSAIRHGSDGAMVEVAGTQPQAKKKGKCAASGAGGAGGKADRSARKLRFSAFDLSSVDMPSDARKNSDVPAKEIVGCLERVLTQSDLMQQAFLEETTTAAPPARAISKRWTALLRGLRTLATATVAPGGGSGTSAVGTNAEPCSMLLGTVLDGCLMLGSKISGRIVSRAAEFLLGELEPLQRSPSQGSSLQSPLRLRLAAILSALIRFNLRRLLNPPPLSYTKQPSSGMMPPIVAAPTTDHSKVHTLMQLVPVDGGNTKRNGAARDGATSAILTMAVGKLHGYTEGDADSLIGEAEAFLSSNDIPIPEDIKGRRKLPDAAVLDMLNRLSDRDVLESLIATARQARQHLAQAVEVLAAFNARSFVLGVLEHPGVEDAIAQAGGWGDVERFSSSLKKVKDCPDADVHLTLLSDMSELKAWLYREELWLSSGRGRRAQNVFKRLDRLIVTCAENQSAVIRTIEDSEIEKDRRLALANHGSARVGGGAGRAGRSCSSRAAAVAAVAAAAAAARGGGSGGARQGDRAGSQCRSDGGGVGGSKEEERGMSAKEARNMKGITLREAKEIGQEALWQMDFPMIDTPRIAGQETDGAALDTLVPSSV